MTSKKDTTTDSLTDYARVIIGDGYVTTHSSSINPPTSAPPKEMGKRYNAGKLRLDLLPPEWEVELARVMTKGAEKYAPRNWEKGMEWSKMVASARRHLLQFQLKNSFDEETGCHHLAMAAWNLLALMCYDMHRLGEEDLPACVTYDAEFNAEYE